MSNLLHADVLIVTVTRVESRAVLAAFESATAHKATPVSIGDKVYRDLGSLNGTRAFMALSEMGSSGPASSLQAVAKGISAMHPAAVVMVGIAFGMNDKKQTLGDILVSRQLMLYDAQRVGTGQIVPRGDRVHCSPWLLDHLKSADLDWDGAQVRFGLLLTGEKLVDNIDYRDQLKQIETEAIGGEMEGGGLYVACQDAKVDWVLVKAICDWADGNKAQDKDARQQQAAKNAAEFVVHALRHASLHRHDASPGAAAASTPHSSTQNQEIGSIVVAGSGNSIVIQQSGNSSAMTPIPPMPAAPRPSKRMPTRASLRMLLGAVLRTSIDLQSFFVDRFPDVAGQIGGGMARSACEDLLFQKHDTDEILARLQRHDSHGVRQYESLLEWEAR